MGEVPRKLLTFAIKVPSSPVDKFQKSRIIRPHCEPKSTDANMNKLKKLLPYLLIALALLVVVSWVISHVKMKDELRLQRNVMAKLVEPPGEEQSQPQQEEEQPPTDNPGAWT
jgi:hypothetical protein